MSVFCKPLRRRQMLAHKGHCKQLQFTESDIAKKQVLYQGRPTSVMQNNSVLNLFKPLLTNCTVEAGRERLQSFMLSQRVVRGKAGRPL